MSLKELISSLIESVFTSKKSYIATQCLPNGNAVYQEFVDTQSSTTAPFSGWVRIQAHCSRLQGSTNGIFFTLTNQNEDWPCLSLPIQKGQTVNWNAQGLVEGNVGLWFIHNQTNE